MTREPHTWRGISLWRLRLHALLFATVMATAAGGCPPAVAAEVDAVGVSAPTGFAEVIERVRPAVVGVRVKTDERAQPGNIQFGAPQLGSPFERFLRQFGIIPEDPAPKSGLSVGSGFFISGDGYIVTNNHVIAGGRSLEVTTDDGKVFQARVIGTDPQTDLALIKIATQVDLPYVRFATAAEPKIGDWVLPIGNPFGLGGTVTAGIVSARGRDIGEGPYNDFIQIDAPVNKGNSGGPTFNVRGEVIGVNTAIYSPSGGSVGVAFDVPAETVKLIIEQLKSKGRVTRGSIGVQLQTVTPMIAEAVGLKKAEGALVAQVEANGPAARHGVEVGDVIATVNDQEVKEPREFARTIAAIAPGTAVRLGLFRNGRETAVVVRLGEMSAEAPKTDEQIGSGEKSALGLTIASARSLPGMGERGVVIVEINPESDAADSGLQVGDIVLSIAGQLVNAPGEVDRIVNEARAHSKRAILIRFKRDQMSGFVAIPIG